MNCLFGGNTCTWVLILVIVFLLSQNDCGCGNNCGSIRGNGCDYGCDHGCTANTNNGCSNNCGCY